MRHSGSGSGIVTDQIEDNTDGLETLIAETNARLGDEAEGVAVSDTATSGLNGLIKRLAQHLTNIFTRQADGTQNTHILAPDSTEINFNLGAVGAKTIRVVAGLMDSAGNAFSSFLGASIRALAIFNPFRPSELRSRTFVVKSADSVTATTTIHTVTAGKTFYLESFGLSAFNTSTTVAGRVAVGNGTSVVLPHTWGTSVVGAAPPVFVAVSEDLSDPPSFTDSVRLVISAGTVTASMWIIGYEE